MKTKKVENLT